MPGLSFQKHIQQDNTEAGTQPQVQTDGQPTSQSPPSPELTSEENKAPDADKANEKKVDQPPEAKKPKIKVVNVELPVEANLVWQLGRDLLNMYIETEVSAVLRRLDLLVSAHRRGSEGIRGCYFTQCGDSSGFRDRIKAKGWISLLSLYGVCRVLLLRSVH